MARLFRTLPAIAVVSAILTTLVFGAASRAKLDAFSNDLSRGLAEVGFSHGTPVPTNDEVKSAHRLAKTLRSAWRLLALVFIVSTATALWQRREQAGSWPWLSALAFAVGLGVLAFAIAFTGLWGLPIALAVGAVALSSFELALYRSSGRPTGLVTWAALAVSIVGLIANLVHPRGY